MSQKQINLRPIAEEIKEIVLKSGTDTELYKIVRCTNFEDFLHAISGFQLKYNVNMPEEIFTEELSNDFTTFRMILVENTRWCIHEGNLMNKKWFQE